MDKQPKPTDWHKYRDSNGHCLWCGCPARKLTVHYPRHFPSERSQHRKTPFGWERRRPSKAGWVTWSVPAKRQHNPRRGVSDRVRAGIIKATAIIAFGQKQDVAAEAVGVKGYVIHQWKRRWPELWREALAQATEIATAIAQRAVAKEQPADAEEAGPVTGERARQLMELPTEYQFGPLSDTEGEGVTLADFFSNTYVPLRLLGCSPGTVQQYQICIRAFSVYAGRPVCVSDLSDELVAGFLQWHLGRGHSAYTANKNRRHLLALWRLAHRRKLIAELPDIPPLKTPKKIPECWSLEEFGRLLQAASETKGSVSEIPAGKWWTALLLCLYDSALRISALMLAERQHLNLEAATLYVPAENQKHSCDQKFSLHPDTVRALSGIVNGNPDAKLFPWPCGKRYLWTKFRRIVERAGLTCSTRGHDLFHRVRRTSATFVANELGRAAAQDHLGHSSMVVTEMYLDRSKITRVQAADVLPRPTLPTGGNAA